MAKHTKIGSGAACNQLLCRYKTDALRRHVQWELTKEQFVELTSSNCYYTGKSPSQICKSKRSTYIYNGIDRVNNDLGYNIENCVSACKEVNMGKYTYSKDEYINMCKQIVLLHG